MSANIVLHHSKGDGSVEYAGVKAPLGSTFPVITNQTLKLKSSCHKKFEITVTNQSGNTVNLTGPASYSLTLGESATLSTCKCETYLITLLLN